MSAISSINDKHITAFRADDVLIMFPSLSLMNGSVSFCNGANGATVETVEIVPVVETSVEVETVGVVAIILITRSGPIAAVRTTILYDFIVAVPRSREEYTVSVRTSNLLTIYTIDRSPLPSTVV